MSVLAKKLIQGSIVGTSPGSGSSGGNTGGTGGTSTQAIAVAHDGSTPDGSRDPPPVTVYAWSPETGFGFKYSDPSVWPPKPHSSEQDVQFSKSGNAIIVTAGGHQPYAYRWSGSGFGARYTNPSTMNTAFTLKFSPSGNAVAFLWKVWRWSDETGFGEKYADPTTGLTNLYPRARSLSWSPNEDAIAIGNDTADGRPRVSVWRWSPETGFGTLYTTPYMNIWDPTIRALFCPTGNAIVLIHDNPYTSSQYSSKGLTSPLAFRWSSATGFGTQYTQSSINGNRGRGGEFNAAGTWLAYTTDTQPGIMAFPWSDSTGCGTRVAPPGFYSGGVLNSKGVTFSPAEDAVAVAVRDAPYVLAFRWSNTSGFGAKYSDPSVLASTYSGANNVAFVNIQT